MIKTTTCVIAVCDICGAKPPGLNDGETHFEVGREADALNEADGAEWWTERTTNLVLCDKRDEPHTAKARQILAELGHDETITFLTYWPELDPQGRSERELRSAWFENLPPLEAPLVPAAEPTDPDTKAAP